MRKIVFALSYLLLSTCAFAQEKLLTMEDAMVNYRTTLAAQNLRSLQFVYGTEDYVYLKRVNGADAWVKGNINTKQDAPFLSLQQLNNRLRTAALDTAKVMPAIQFNQSADWILTIDNSKISLNPLTNKATIVIDKQIATKENLEDGKAGYVAYLDNYNLFVAKGDDTKQVTTDGSTDIVYASAVHREEFGITKGTFWSPSGTLLAFYRMDQSMVTDYPIIDWTKRPAKNENIKYPMAGDKSHHVTLGIYNTQNKGVVWLKTGEPTEQYLTNVAWGPDDKYVYIAVLNREQNHMKMNQYDAVTGLFIKTLFEEKDDKYVEPQVPILFLNNDPSKFIWQSRRDGWNHLYLYDVNGTLIKQLTKGNWEVTEVKGLDSKGENLFYISTQESPLARNLYSYNLKTGKISAITLGMNTHTSQVSTTGQFVLDSYTNLKDPRTVQLVESATGKTKILLQAENPLAGYQLAETEIITIKNKAGIDLYGNLFKPVNFDSNKKYPVIVYWYGGSHNQLVTSSWNSGSSDYWFQYMAERGYVVFKLDVRGSDNRGKAFEQAMFRKIGDVQMEDMMTGIDYLKSLPFVDQNNMGLFGWSFGGFNTIDFMVNHPGVFKAAVAGGPVTDWQYYEIMYTERYMDTPQENPEGYAATDLTKLAGNLKGKLLLIHGLQDNVVVQEHSVRFVKAAVDKNVQADYMIYPGHEHNVLGKDRAHLYQKVTDYFMQNLK